MANTHKSGSHSRYLLQYHLIFVCKYRRKLLVYPSVIADIKALSKEICSRHNVVIHYMESDKDHIHYMIETTPNVNLADFVKTIKSYTTYHIWQKYPQYLSRFFWKEHTFWSDGYFLATIGNVSQETLKHYILNQGKKQDYICSNLYLEK